MANIGANPSTADEIDNDPTVRKDIGFANRLGFGGLLKLNVGAYRATDPKVWMQARDPFGFNNDIESLRRYLVEFDVRQTVAAWGKCLGRFAYKGDLIAKAIPDLWCFGKNADGSPRHTLMLSYSTPLERYIK